MDNGRQGGMGGQGDVGKWRDRGIDRWRENQRDGYLDGRMEGGVVGWSDGWMDSFAGCQGSFPGLDTPFSCGCLLSSTGTRVILRRSQCPGQTSLDRVRFEENICT